MVAGALAAVGLTGFQRRSCHTLSGGERQRLAIAGALAQVELNNSLPVIVHDIHIYVNIRYIYSGQLYAAPATFEMVPARGVSPTPDVFAGPGKIERVIPYSF